MRTCRSITLSILLFWFLFGYWNLKFVKAITIDKELQCLNRNSKDACWDLPRDFVDILPNFIVIGRTFSNLSLCNSSTELGYVSLANLSNANSLNKTIIYFHRDLWKPMGHGDTHLADNKHLERPKLYYSIFKHKNSVRTICLHTRVINENVNNQWIIMNMKKVCKIAEPILLMCTGNKTFIWSHITKNGAEKDLRSLANTNSYEYGTNISSFGFCSDHELSKVDECPRNEFNRLFKGNHVMVVTNESNNPKEENASKGKLKSSFSSHSIVGAAIVLGFSFVIVFIIVLITMIYRKKSIPKGIQKNDRCGESYSTASSNNDININKELGIAIL